MNKLFGFLCKKEEPVVTPVYGITEGEYRQIRIDLESELIAATGRQRPGTKEPSAYMKGLQFAINLLDSIDTHIVGVKQ